MGWGGGTQIFDTVVRALKTTQIPDEKQEHILWNLLDVLEDQDWDNHSESDYWDDPDVKYVIQQMHPNWFEDDE